MIDYRDATPDDAALMAKLGAETFTETFGHLYSPENLAAFLENHVPGNWARELGDPAFAVRIAEDDGEPAGYCKIGPPSLPFPVSGPTAELRQLYVLKPWHGAGVARTLMDWSIAKARERGAEEMFLSVFVDNHRARRFYARYGFEQVGTYDFMVGTHADLDLVMRLKL
jgi:ribosomal protein S18 acetylase RimI-like enzyme